MTEQGGARSLIVSCSDCRPPRWTPVQNDNRIVYSTSRFTGSFDDSAINIVNADGSGRKTLLQSTDHNDSNLRSSRSPDGKRIVFNSSMFGGRDLVVVTADGTNAKRIALQHYELAPAWGR